MTAPELGLLLLEGKNPDLVHGVGASLLGAFRAAFRQGPVCVLGRALANDPDVLHWKDAGEGPAMALRHWARNAPPMARRWWVVNTDLQGWTTPSLLAWYRRAASNDPDARRWVLAKLDGHMQPFGGFLSDTLLPRVAVTQVDSLEMLIHQLPQLLLTVAGDPWQPEAF